LLQAWGAERETSNELSFSNAVIAAALLIGEVVMVLQGISLMETPLDSHQSTEDIHLPAEANRVKFRYDG